jgi:uncharacterized protein involved in response to NO
MTIDEPHRPPHINAAFDRHPLFALGFRPFYLLAAAFAAISVPAWLLRYFGMAPALSHVDLNWHVHEMVFGFAIAVIIGFVYTAGRNWTGLWTPRGRYLAGIAALWLAGRIAMLLSSSWASSLIDIAFLPLATWPLYRVLQQSGNRRNLFLVGLLGLLSIANLMFHAAVHGGLALSPLQPLHAAILVIVLIESVIAGRVVPNFTANAVPGVKPWMNPRRDQIILAFTALTCIGWVAGFAPVLIASLALATAVSQALRLAGWKSHRTLHNPLLWILHVSYGWIPLGFVLLGLAALDVVPASAAFHVLAIGSMAGLIIGMMTRTALGHTGRPLKSGMAETAMYALIQLGALARLCAALDLHGVRNVALVVTAGSWSLAFLLYLIVYAPYLTRPRIDGREG